MRGFHQKGRSAGSTHLRLCHRDWRGLGQTAACVGMDAKEYWASEASEAKKLPRKQEFAWHFASLNHPPKFDVFLFTSLEWLGSLSKRLVFSSTQPPTQ